jgi:predicted phosphate transport protein (TIGR00153 family)
MKIDNFLQFFLPKNNKFFPLFEEATSNLVHVSHKLVELVSLKDSAARLVLIKEIEDLEHVGDGLSHKVNYELNSNFITPFDREDIHALIVSIDDIVDYIHGAAKRMDLYNVKEIPPEFVGLAEVNLKAAQQLHIAVTNLKNLKNRDLIKQACIEINSLENEADDIFDNAVAKLFETCTDAIELIKIKEILSAIETATDKCEDAAVTIDGILVKNA